MVVKINWGTGGMSVDADYLLGEMPLKNFRKWCKLLAQFGEEDTKQDMLAFCQKEIQVRQDAKRRIESRLRDFAGKLGGSIPYPTGTKVCARTNPSSY